MVHPDSDLDRIKELIEIMKDNELVELEIKHGEDKIFLKRSQPQVAVGGPVTAVPRVGQNTIPTAQNATQIPATEAKPAATEPQAEEHLVEIKSPIVGTFYATPSPDSEPFVELDSHVSSQTVVCIVEAMKVMNEIKAETSGTIAEILVKNGQAVEYGQLLFRVRPD